MAMSNRQMQRMMRAAFDRRALLRGAAAAGVAPLAGSWRARGAAAQGEPIRVGAIIPFTGLETHNGLSMQYGLEIGTAEINEAGGLAGRQVEVIMEDDGSDVARGVRAAAKLVGQDNVDFLNGTLTSSVRTAVFEETRPTRNALPESDLLRGAPLRRLLLQHRRHPQPGDRADGGVRRGEPRRSRSTSSPPTTSGEQDRSPPASRRWRRPAARSSARSTCRSAPPTSRRSSTASRRPRRT